MEKPVIIFGAGYLGRISKEIFDQNGVEVYGFLDESPKLKGKEVDDITVWGDLDDEKIMSMIGKTCEAFVALNDILLRKNIIDLVNRTYHTQPVNAVHKTVSISRNASIGHGNLIDSNTIIGVGAVVHNHCIIGAQSTVGVETQIADFVWLGMGVSLGHGVCVEEGAFLGDSVTVVSGVTIGQGARVGAGSVVMAPVAKGETVLGNPAQIYRNT